MTAATASRPQPSRRTSKSAHSNTARAASATPAFMAGKVTTPGISVYCATKHAVAALSRSLRAELADTAVTVTTVLPTAVHTELTAGVTLDLLPTRQPERIDR